MTDIRCIYPDREAVLIAYLYDDIDRADRVAFETHVTTCQACRGELAEMQSVRSTLGEWVAPETPARVFTFEPRTVSSESRTAWWHNVPVWAQVAAAMLVLGLSASIANLDIRYGAGGLNITTGWSKRVPAESAAPVAAAATAAPVTATDAVTSAQLDQVRAELQSQIRAQSVALKTVSTASAAPMPDGEFQQRVRMFVRTLLDESEKRQETQLARQIVQLQKDLYAVRQADVKRTNDLFHDMNNVYGGQIMKQQQQINYLLPAAQR
jgi:anti-sigma factor RsiW